MVRISYRKPREFSGLCSAKWRYWLFNKWNSDNDGFSTSICHRKGIRLFGFEINIVHIDYIE